MVSIRLFPNVPSQSESAHGSDTYIKRITYMKKSCYLDKA